MENWTKADEFIAWPARLNQAAEFEVSAFYDAPADAVGGRFTVKLGKQNLSGVVEPDGTTSLGRIRLNPGQFEIEVVPVKLNGTELMRLRNLRLTVVE